MGRMNGLTNSDMLKKQNDCCDGQLASHRRDQLRRDDGCADMLEARGDSLENRDGSGCTLGDPPGSDGEDDDHDGVSEDRDEEGGSAVLWVAAFDVGAGPLHGVETGMKSRRSE
jgi:hypothetical protein